VTIADEVDAQLREQMKLFKAADVAEKAKGKWLFWGRFTMPNLERPEQ
jgi:hypothetical protein